MYPGSVFDPHSDTALSETPCFVMASTGESVSYAVFEQRSNRLAQLLHQAGLRRLDHYSILMENNDRYLEACAAGERSGLYYTCVNSYLTGEEVGYILQNSESQVLITSASRLPAAVEAIAASPNVRLCLVVGSDPEALATIDSHAQFVDYAASVAEMPSEPLAEEWLGGAMLYSSGTTGQPKGIIRPLPEEPPSTVTPLFGFLDNLWRYRKGMIYLSPAPLYHSAPQAAVNLTIRQGGTVIIMERFDPEEYLKLIEQYSVTHSQLVPTMFSRMLKLPDEVRSRYDLSSLEFAVHAAAPCPVQVKEQMIEWWGPIIHEYYGATEGLGFTACDAEAWLAHRGTVGKVLLGTLHVLDDDGNECETGTPGTLWFETATEFEYFNDPAKTAEASSADGTMTSVGDVGYVDEDGYLYLTDRATFMIISGGVNIYPQETENLLITHPLVADAAVFGVPNEDLGEEVKAVVQLMPGVEESDETVETLLAFCREHLSRQKVPRTIDFEAELPRLPTGKLYKRTLRDRYWGEGSSRILGA